MKTKEFIPFFIKDYLKLIYLKYKYRGRKIYSHRIQQNVILGVSCSIGRDVELCNGVILGDFSYINSGTIVASGKIGKFCSIAYNCQIGLPDHPTNFLSTSPRIYGPHNIFTNPSKWQPIHNPPIIGNDVWIGSNAIIMQGVVVSDGAIIASGSVVTKSVPPYTIVAGVPARIIRTRFSDDIINKLLKIKWWDLQINNDELGQICKLNEDWVSMLPLLEGIRTPTN